MTNPDPFRETFPTHPETEADRRIHATGPRSPRIFVERAYSSPKRTYLTISIPDAMARCLVDHASLGDPVAWQKKLTELFTNYIDDVPF